MSGYKEDASPSKKFFSKNKGQNMDKLVFENSDTGRPNVGMTKKQIFRRFARDLNRAIDKIEDTEDDAPFEWQKVTHDT